MNQHVPVIAVDGPSGAGKGTLCQKLAQHYGYNLLDSGAIYRVLALASLHHDIDLNNEEALALMAGHLDVRFEASDELVRVILEGEDVSADLRQETTGNAASKVAAFPRVREALLRRQRAFREAPGLVADGRDMGSVVFTDAPVKIFLDATADERAKRRYNQLQQKGLDVNFEHLLNDIKERDHRDRNRSVAPLVAADDALVIDSTSLSIESVVEQAKAYIEKRLTR